jgi:ADP-ribose pyrophosphatase
VDPGEKVSKTLQREFFEEAMDASSGDEKEKIQKFFESSGVEIYSGYVDDPRNTDNSWMETVAYNYHDPEGSVFGEVNLRAGDDAVGVQWKDLDGKLQLYASHSMFIKKIADMLNAHW